MLPRSWTMTVSCSYLQVQWGEWAPGPPDGAGVGTWGTWQGLPYLAGHPPSTWSVEVVDVEAGAGHDVGHFLKLQ